MPTWLIFLCAMACMPETGGGFSLKIGWNLRRNGETISDCIIRIVIISAVCSSPRLKLGAHHHVVPSPRRRSFSRTGYSRPPGLRVPMVGVPCGRHL